MKIEWKKKLNLKCVFFTQMITHFFTTWWKPLTLEVISEVHSAFNMLQHFKSMPLWFSICTLWSAALYWYEFTNIFISTSHYAHLWIINFVCHEVKHHIVSWSLNQHFVAKFALYLENALISCRSKQALTGTAIQPIHL